MTRWVWLSHLLDTQTPLYGGEDVVHIVRDKDMAAGATCNTSRLSLPSHSGTHVDAPLHFLADGRGTDTFPPEFWVFRSPRLLDVTIRPGQLIGADDIDLGADDATELLLLRTGFEAHRFKRLYWENGPGLSCELASIFRQRLPKLKAVGFDFISLSSFQHRNEGREAHRHFLRSEILIIEDMALSDAGGHTDLEQVIALPLRFRESDGAPCTVIGLRSA